MMRVLALLASLLMAALGAGANAVAKTQPAAPVDFVPFGNLEETPLRLGCFTFDGAATLNAPPNLNDGIRFGGYSGLLWRGDALTLVSDAGHVAELSVTTDQEHRPTGVRAASVQPLLSKAGTPLSKTRGDAEAILPTSNGLLVAFERDHRLTEYRRTAQGWTPTGASWPVSNRDLRPNGGIEAMTRLPPDDLLIIGENVTADGTAAARLLRETDGTAVAEGRYAPAPSFAVTDLSYEPETGDLWVLERAYSRELGPRARIVRVRAEMLAAVLAHWRAAAPDASPVLKGEEITRLNLLHGVDNMEGLAVRGLKNDQVRLVMISDDNFSNRQRTVLLTGTVPKGSCTN